MHLSSRASLGSIEINQVTSNISAPSDSTQRLHHQHTVNGVEDPKSAFPTTATVIGSQSHAVSLPDGGLTAWLQVLGVFFCWFNSWCDMLAVIPTLTLHVDKKSRGLTNAFGVFQTYYQIQVLRENTPTQISWIGSVQSFLLIAIGVFTGSAYDAGYFKALIWTGSSLVVIGYMMTSLCTSYWQIMLAQGLVVGVGSVRIVAFIALGTCGVALAILKVRTKPPKRRLLFDVVAFKELPFAFFTSGLFFGLMGVYIPAFYIQNFAIQGNMTDGSLATFLLPILNAAGVFGRIVPNIFADKFGPLNMLIPFTAMAGLMVFVWIAVINTGGLIVFALFFGIASSAILSLLPTVIASLSPSLGVIGTRFGTCCSVASLGLLIGTPVSGAILTNTGHFVGLQAFAGTMLMLSAILFGATRYCR